MNKIIFFPKWMTNKIKHKKNKMNFKSEKAHFILAYLSSIFILSN